MRSVVCLMVAVSGLAGQSGGFLAAQERALIVKSGDRQVVRLAHLFGVAPERVLVGRELLREATGLAIDLAASEDIQTVGELWISVDREDSGEELVGLLSELPPSRQTLSSLRTLLAMYGRRGDPERVAELAGLWVQAAHSVLD